MTIHRDPLLPKSRVFIVINNNSNNNWLVQWCHQYTGIRQWARQPMGGSHPLIQATNPTTISANNQREHYVADALEQTDRSTAAISIVTNDNYSGGNYWVVIVFGIAPLLTDKKKNNCHQMRGLNEARKQNKQKLFGDPNQIKSNQMVTERKICVKANRF